MGLLEDWGENEAPNRIGSIGLAADHDVCRCRPLVMARFAFVMIGLPVAWCLAVPQVPMPTLQAGILIVGGTLIYVALAYLVNPKPNLGDVIAPRSIVDHAWYDSDDANRVLLNLLFFLGPGRFVAESVLDMLLLFQRENADPLNELRRFSDER